MQQRITESAILDYLKSTIIPKLAEGMIVEYCSWGHQSKEYFQCNEYTEGLPFAKPMTIDLYSKDVAKHFMGDIGDPKLFYQATEQIKRMLDAVPDDFFSSNLMSAIEKELQEEEPTKYTNFSIEAESIAEGAIDLITEKLKGLDPTRKHLTELMALELVFHMIKGAKELPAVRKEFLVKHVALLLGSLPQEMCATIRLLVFNDWRETEEQHRELSQFR